MGLPVRRIPLAIVAVPLLLAGCAVPAITIASYSFDGFSYATTGKSVSDMALSQASDRNCALWRALLLRPVCRDYTPEEREELLAQRERTDENEADRAATRMGEPVGYLAYKSPHPPAEGSGPGKGTTSIASAARIEHPSSRTADHLEPGYDSDPALTAPSPADASERHAYADLYAGAGHPELAALKQASPSTSTTRLLKPGAAREAHPANVVKTAAAVPAVKAAPARAGSAGAGDVYLVLASYGSRPNAERALALYSDVKPSLVEVMTGGKPIHRVVSGPYAPKALAEARARIEKAYGIRDSWTMRSCASEGLAGCVATAPPERAQGQLAALPGAD